MTKDEALYKVKGYLTDIIPEENYSEVEEIIKALEQDADRPTGEWIRISNDWIDGTCGARYFPIRCSVCGYSTYDDDATKFCPNCGADMRGEK